MTLDSSGDGRYGYRQKKYLCVSVCREVKRERMEEEKGMKGSRKAFKKREREGGGMKGRVQTNISLTCCILLLPN